MPQVRLAACQINTVVGDLAGNVERILAALAAAERRAPTWPCSPSWPSPGTRPRTSSASRPSWPTTWPAFAKVAAATGECAVVVGFVDVPHPAGRLVNAAAVCAGRRGRRRLPQAAACPTTASSTSSAGSLPGDGPPTALRGGRRARSASPSARTCGSPTGPMAEPGRGRGPTSWSTSTPRPTPGAGGPSAWPCWPTRVAEAGCAIVYVNQVGGQDELVFDGDSLVVDGRRRRCVASAAQFAEELVVVDLPIGSPTRPRAATGLVPRVAGDRAAPGDRRHAAACARSPPCLDPVAEVYEALVLGTRDYLGKNGFSDAVIGLSGGIDSSLVAADRRRRPRRRAGARHVHAVALLERGLA